MYKVIVIIILTAELSCTNQYVVRPLGDDIDEIQVHGRYNGLLYSTTDTGVIHVFKQVLNGKWKRKYQSYEIDCDPQGWIWFMSGKAVREIGTFSNTAPDCTILSVTEDQGDPFYIFKLTDQASIYLDSVMTKK